MKHTTKHTIVRNFILAIIVTTNGLMGCKKLVNIRTSGTSVNVENAYTQDVLAAAVINGMYAGMSNSTVSEANNLSSFCTVYPALMADELTLDATLYNLTEGWYRNNLNSVEHGGKPWTGVYNSLIYVSNSAIAGIGESQTLTPAVRNQLLGDAYFMRALGYYYLTNLYGDVPLVLTTDYQKNMDMARTPQQQVFAQIIMDLEQAKSLLSDGYIAVDGKTPTSGRITPNKSAAQALLARAYLYSGNYSAAEAEATSVINKTNLYSLAALDGIFLASSSETIWQLQPVRAGENVQEAMVLVTPATGPDPDHPYTLSNQLLAAFEAGDQRKVKWIGSRTVGTNTFYYSNKYKSGTINLPVTENKIVLRLSELYLIRSEARARLGTNLTGAKDDLNLIRNRAGLGNTMAINTSDVIAAVGKERQVELFLEWGDRWFDLKRTGAINTVMPAVSTAKGGVWSSYKQWCPIPLGDLQRAPNLVQNPGY